MQTIEARLTLNLDQPTTETGVSQKSDPLPNNQLWTLLNALDDDKLDAQQQAILAQLRGNLLALTEPARQPVVA